MGSEGQFHADDWEKQVSVGRYLRFVITFLLIMFSALGAYEYYYGAQEMKAEQLQQSFDQPNQAPAYSATAATSSGAAGE